MPFSGPLDRTDASGAVTQTVTPERQNIDTGHVKSSGLIAVTAGAAVTAISGRLQSVIVIVGSATTTVTIYDNATAASGTVIFKASSPASQPSVIFAPPRGVEFKNGMFIVVAGTAAEAIVHFSS